jgi:HD superfamily phosphodiesterase
MFSSVQAGLRATEREHGGVFIHLVDIPLLHPSTIKKMASSFAGRATNQWIAPAFEGSGRRGHPVLIPRCWGEAIEAWDGAEGLRGFLARRKAVTVPVFDEGILMDMDAPEDLDRLIIWSKRRHVPGRSTIHALLKAAGTPSHVALHQRRVSEVASTTGQLCGRHVSVDLELLTAAAELHDILKVEPDHAQRGADFLAENGFPEAAELVRGHMDLPETPSVEAQLLYLADRYVNGSTLESLQERERRMTQKFAGDEAAQRAALRRIEVARDIERQVENLTGARPLLHYVATQCSKRRL